MKKPSKQELISQSVDNLLILYRTKFNLSSEYRTRPVEARLGSPVGIVKYLNSGGFTVVLGYTSPEELVWKISEALVSGQPIF